MNRLPHVKRLKLSPHLKSTVKWQKFVYNGEKTFLFVLKGFVP